ncbi:hypothetical protein BOX15_Mlig014620g1 [Macrostomum lignano]|uniref:Uncharacterized protein n=1 Tax=Macrostomum lignano TaxID=282301 RepID=A0A267E0Z1_9PLAT|nr:hypothetical protein BOX15_Mlig014620g1 [Macrostomum lignano]
MNNRSEEQTETLLDKCGDLLIAQSQQLQQMLQQQRQSSEAASSAAGLSRKLCSALLILELHSNYSGRLFDLLKSELLTALNLELNTLRNIDVSSLDYREATRLLKDLCLRSKAMSHDVIKGSRDLLKAFKTVQRSDKRPRSSSALSRVRDLAMAPSKCRSNSQSGRQTATASRRDATGTSKADRPMAQKPMMVKSFALFGLKKSLTDRPPKQLPPLPPATASTPVPAASSPEAKGIQVSHSAQSGEESLVPFAKVVETVAATACRRRLRVQGSSASTAKQFPKLHATRSAADSTATPSAASAAVSVIAAEIG